MLQTAINSLRISHTHIRSFAFAVCLSLGYTSSVALNLKWASFGLFVAAFVLLLGMTPMVKRHMVLILFSAGLMSVAPIGTSTAPLNIVLMGLSLFFAIMVPFVVSRFIYKDHHGIHFNFDWKRRWRGQQIIFMIGFTILTYIGVPIYFAETGAQVFWQLEPNAVQITIVALSVLLIGLWEEFFFIATILATLQRFIPFVWANLLQATMFSAFLYQVGFRYWIIIFTFSYALFQGFIFHRTKSLLYAATVHILVDLAFLAALFNAFFPGSVHIF